MPLVRPSSSRHKVSRPTRPVHAAAKWRLAALALAAACCGSVAGCIDEPELRRAALVDTCTGIADGALCNDQNACTTGDRCAAGVCVGSPAMDGTPCTDGNQCTGSDVCQAGLCLGTALAEGVTCTDGDPCTDSDTCRMGTCTGGAMHVCNDGIACTNDSCVRGVGCRFDPTPACPDGAMTDGGMDAVDALPDADAVSPPDVLPPDISPPDGPGPDVPDGPAPDRPDVSPDLQTDVVPDIIPDIVPDISGPDGGTPDASDARVDADGGGEGEAGRDGPDGALDAADARDAQADTADAGAPDEAVREFEARGGACACAMDGSPAATASGWLSVLAMALVIPVLTRRRRR